ncbi:sensor histidine kinase [Oligoflexus tunisiensis]|uniref:sensor histidine kinase n=1 Tax=Oligoflexus tunisiensis TaxID=708132 RepID=UPI00159F0044|nr:ATP-binding protein [Oligoflexus tunisiensis]
MSAHPFVSLWDYISESGLRDAMSERERRRIRFSNQNTAIIAVLILVSFPPVFWLVGQPTLALVTLLSALHFGCIFLINRWSGSLTFGRLYTIFNYNAVTLFYSLALGPGAGIQYVFLTCASAPFILLDYRRRASFIVCSLAPVLLFFFVETMGLDLVQPLPLTAEQQRLIHLATMPFVFATVFLYSGYFYLHNQKSENKLRRTIADLRTSQTLIEEQQTLLVASSRLSAIGELAGSIAHEINNPLGIVKGYSDQLVKLVQREPLDRHRVSHASQKISETTDRMSQIIMSLRRLSYEGQGDPFERVDLVQVVDDTLAICRQSIRELGIELIFERPPGPCHTMGRPLQLGQVLLNLIQNARDAVENLDPKWIRISIRKRDSVLELAVEDSGQGLQPDVLARVGQPFFTTKPFGKGTGLGISISRKIMAAHGGSIEVDTRHPNTRFVVALLSHPA